MKKISTFLLICILFILVTILFILVTIVVMLGIFVYKYIDWRYVRYTISMFSSNREYIITIIILIVLMLVFIVLFVFLLSKYNKKKNSNNRIIAFFQGFKFITFLYSFIMIFNFTIIITTFSILNNFNSEVDAYNNLFKNNQEYILPLNKYVEDNTSTLDEYGKRYYYGTRFCDGGIEKKDVSDIKKQLEGTANIYEKYEYILPFNIINSYKYINSNFYAKSINNICVVDDFGTFSQKLEKGTYPNSYDEVLIYDYMEESLIKSGIISETAVGKQIYNTNLEQLFKISGVVKSIYKNFSYLSNQSIKDKVSSEYLNELCTIFVKNEFCENLNNNLKFDGVNLVLSRNWEENKTIINKLLISKKDDEYYQSISNNTKIYGYAIDTPFKTVIERAKLATSSYYIPLYLIPPFTLILSLIVSIWFYQLLFSKNLELIKKIEFRKRGIILYFLSMLITVLTTCVISIPFVRLVELGLSNDFRQVNSIFNLNSIAIVYSILIGLLYIIVGIAYFTIKYKKVKKGDF